LIAEEFIFFPLPEPLSGAVTTAAILQPFIIILSKQISAKVGVPKNTILLFFIIQIKLVGIILGNGFVLLQLLQS